MRSFRDVIDLWPGPGISEFAKAAGVPESHARTMRARDSIPPGYWDSIVKDADQRGLPVTLETLSQLAKPRQPVRATETA